MVDFATSEKRSSMGWIIGGIVVLLIVLFIVFGGSGAPISGDGSVTPEAAPAAETQTPAVETAPAATE